MAALVCCCIATPASAQDLQLRPVAHTDFPVFAGAGVDIEGPFRLRLSSSVGVLPDFMISTTNAVLVPLLEDSGYGQEEAALVELALQDSIVWRTTLGMRPFEKRGFVFGIGYTIAGLGGAATGAEVIEAVAGSPLPNAPGAVNVDIGATIHLLHAEVGWQWTLWRNLWLRTGLGGAWLFFASSTTEVTTGRGRVDWDAFETASEQWLDDTLTTYVHPPHATLSLGWTF